MRRPVLALSLVLSAALAVVVTVARSQSPQPVLGSRAVNIITADGRSFRDLNRSGALDRTRTGGCRPTAARPTWSRA
jgi:hypothetical protein